MKNIIQISGNKFTLNGETFVPKGVNLGNWLNIEHFMHGLPSVENDMHKQMLEIFGQEKKDKYWEAYRDAYINEADFEFIASKGFNCVRLPINCNLFYETEIFGERAFKYIDRTFEWAAKHKIYVQLDLHALPGGQARDHNADPPYGIYTAFWDHAFFRDQALDIIEALAERYKNEPYLWEYAPACEPMTHKVHILKEYYHECIRRIRKHDQHHIITLEPNHWARDISSLNNELFDDPQVTYQIHIYFFFHCDYNAMDDYPCNNPKISFGKKDLINMVEKSIDKERINRPVTLAEFGVVFSMTKFMNGVKDKQKMKKIISKGTRDLRIIFEETLGGWCLWSYKDKGVMGLVYPDENTPWIKFLNQPKYQALHQWIDSNFLPNFKETQEALPNFQKELKNKFNQIDYDTIASATLATMRNIESLFLRTLLMDMNNLPEDQLMELAASFSLNNCQLVPELDEIILKESN